MWPVHFNRPISGLGTVSGWKELPIIECGEPLVALGAFSSYPEIATDAIYAGERTSSRTTVHLNSWVTISCESPERQ